MLRNYNSFTLLLESKKRDNKIAKQKQKIENFLKYDPIINYVFDNVVDSEGTAGLQYTIWFADKIMQDFMLETATKIEANQGKIKNYDLPKIDGKYITELKYVEIIRILKDFLNNREKSRFNNVKFTDKERFIFAERFKEFIKLSWDEYNERIRNKVRTILDWLKSPIREEEKVDLNQYKILDTAYDRAVEWHDNIKATGVIINEKGTVLMTFDDGYYWIDLETTSSQDEANAMGHCGTTHYGDTLFSLRRKQSPHVTTAVRQSYKDGIVYQMKGRNNKKPTEKYHPYILELLKYPNVSDNVKIINGFQPILKFSTNEYKSSEDFHIFDLTGDQIKELAKANKTLIDNSGIGVKYKLYKEKHITTEELIEGYKDLKIIDGKIHFIVDDWTSFDDIFKDNRDRTKGWQTKILSGDGRDYFSYYSLDFDYTYDWEKLTPRLFEELYNLCTHDGYEIEFFDEEKNESVSFIMSSKNTEISPNKDDLWIKTPIGGVLSFENLMKTKNSENINTKQGDVDFTPIDWDDLKDAFDYGYTNAQEAADESKAYDTIIQSIENKIGSLIKKDGNIWWYDDNRKASLHFDLDFDWISEVHSELELSENDYDRIIDIINDIPHIDSYDNEHLIVCDEPYYGFNGTIDGDDLSQEIINRLLYDL